MKVLLLTLAVIASAYAEDLHPIFFGSAEYVPYIIGGRPVSIQDHPHQISLQNSWGSHTCGGAIIGNNKVACAAHCTQGSSRGKRILAGTADRTGGGQVHQVSYVRNHPQFCGSCAGLPNDLSVITTSSSFSFNSAVRAISLGTSSFTGQTCMITGWGRNNVNSGSLPTQLLGANIVILENSDCNRRMGGSIGSGHICVHDYSGREGACQGDSGGPLVCSGQLAGVTSWGYNCNVRYPSIYTRLSHYRNWIQSQ